MRKPRSPCAGSKNPPSVSVKEFRGGRSEPFILVHTRFEHRTTAILLQSGFSGWLAYLL